MTNTAHQRSRAALQLASKYRSWNFVEIANKANEIVLDGEAFPRKPCCDGYLS